MATKQVIAKSAQVVSLAAKGPCSRAPLLRPPGPHLGQPAPTASEVTQASNISPLGPRNLGPCPAPTLRCPPPPCACPEPQTVSMGTRLLRALWFLAKLSLFVAVAQFTVDEGLWGTSEQTEELAQRMGIVSDPDDKKGDQKEDSKEGESESRGWWNSAVVRVGHVFGLQP